MAKAASRALGILIAKSKALGGMPFKCFKKLYETMVLPVIHYGSAIWGHSEFTCISGVHNKACQYFLGVGKYTPKAAVQGDVGIVPSIVNQWINITRNWCNMVNMASHILKRKIMVWSWQYAVNGNCKNLIWKVLKYYKKNNLSDQCIISNNKLNKNDVLSRVAEIAMNNYVSRWENMVSSDTGSTKIGGNKLRTYRMLKTEFKTEAYVKCILGKQQRSALARFRCGTAAIHIETGRYEGLPENERICPVCENVVEDEYHVLYRCPLYTDLREEYYEFSIAEMDVNVHNLSKEEQLSLILSNTENSAIRASAKFCSQILERLSFF